MVLGFFKKIKNALFKTRSFLSKKIEALFGKSWDETKLEALEEILYEADLGKEIASECAHYLRKHLKKEATTPQILEMMEKCALTIFDTPSKTSPLSGHPLVFLLVGVNGSGKTTSLAKLAHYFQSQGKKVLLAAGDTFRAAAVEQLATWAERLQIDIVKALPGRDPSSVAFDALQAALARKIDVVLIDTAGRLQNKTDLMHELEKIRRVCSKVVPHSPHETILVLDATIGQNALDQVETFNKFTPLTGILLSKLDGSAKGGIVLAIYKKFGIPIRWIGTGETVQDLAIFDAKEYCKDLFSLES